MGCAELAVLYALHLPLHYEGNKFYNNNNNDNNNKKLYIHVMFFYLSRINIKFKWMFLLHKQRYRLHNRVDCSGFYPINRCLYNAFRGLYYSCLF